MSETVEIDQEDHASTCVKIIRRAAVKNLEPRLNEGDEVDPDEIKKDIIKVTEKKNCVLAYVEFDQEFNDDTYIDTFGEYVAGTMFLVMYSRTTRALRNAGLDLMRLGFKNSAGRMARPDCGPFDIGGVQFLMWKPLGRQPTPTPFKPNFRLERAIEIKMKIGV